jgi:hypothetical protein
MSPSRIETAVQTPSSFLIYSAVAHGDAPDLVLVCRRGWHGIRPVLELDENTGSLCAKR